MAKSGIGKAQLVPETDAACADTAQQHSGSIAAPDIRNVLRKVSWHLLPVFFALNLLNYLDRTNLAFASIQMSSDLNLTQSEYGTGAGMFFVGYASFQIPSQLVLRRVGAPLWLAIIVSMWGVVACCMAFIDNERSFYGMRLVLGIAESGCFPAGWYYLTKWYPDQYIATPYSITDSALMIAQVVGAPLAAGVLHLDGAAGLHGWQWLFLTEGMPTAALGLCLYFLLPARPAAAQWLPAADAEAVQAAVAKCRGGEDALAQGSACALLRTAFTNRAMYLLGAVKFAKDLTSYGLMFWAPVLIRSLLHSHKKEGDTDSCEAWDTPAAGLSDTGYVEVLLAGIPYTLAATLNVLVAQHSQRTKERRWHITIPYGIAGTLCALLPLFNRLGVVLGFICLTLVIALSLSANGCMLALASAAARGPAMPVNLAVFNSLGNIAGFFGSLLLGVVVDRTCSYSAAYVLMGVVLIAGGLLALTVRDDATLAHQMGFSGCAMNGANAHSLVAADETELSLRNEAKLEGLRGVQDASAQSHSRADDEMHDEM